MSQANLKNAHKLVAGAQRGEQGGAIPQAPNHYGGAKRLRGAQKSSNNVTSTFFNIVHLLPKDLSFEHGGRQT